MRNWIRIHNTGTYLPVLSNCVTLPTNHRTIRASPPFLGRPRLLKILYNFRVGRDQGPGNPPTEDKPQTAAPLEVTTPTRPPTATSPKNNRPASVQSAGGNKDTSKAIDQTPAADRRRRGPKLVRRKFKQGTATQVLPVQIYIFFLFKDLVFKTYRYCRTVTRTCLSERVLV